MSRIEQVTTIRLATHTDARGNLTVVQSDKDIPFSISRVFYIHGAPADCERGAHAHHDSEQVVIALAGSLSLEVTDSRRTATFVLNEPDRAVYLPRMIWARMFDFRANTVCLVLASTPYEASDYIRSWDDYVAAVAAVAETP